jgi:LPS-assembly protein
MSVSIRHFSFLLLTLVFVLPACFGADAEEPVFNLTADEPLVVDMESRETIARGNARMTYGQWTLSADEIRVNGNTNEARASGNIVVTYPGLRFLGNKARYWHNEQRVEVEDFRFGRPPYHISGKRAHGTADRMVMEEIEVLYGEPAKLTPRAYAKGLTLIDQDHFEAEGMRVLLGVFPVFAFTGFARSIEDPQLVWETRAGYQGNLGLHVGAGIYTPVWEGVQPGGNVDIFTKRGVLFGPGVRYKKEEDGSTTKGKSDFNYIHDTSWCPPRSKARSTWLARAASPPGSCSKEPTVPRIPRPTTSCPSAACS